MNQAHRESVQVEGYFHRISNNWDEIYTGQGGLLYNWLNKKLRKGVYNRAKETVEIASREKDNISTALDVGCGSGAVSLQLAQLGVNVTGIDFAKNMIDLGNQYSQKYNVGDSCTFLHGDFLNHDFKNQTFDLTFALGVFDYIHNPEEFLKKMKEGRKKPYGEEQELSIYDCVAL